MNAVENGRLGVAAAPPGWPQACVDAMVHYVRERVVFREPIARFQTVQKMIADSITVTDASCLLVFRLADLSDRGPRARPRRRWPSSPRATPRVNGALAALQIHGAYGVSDGYPVGRDLRDAKVFQIVEATTSRTER